jgi:hypothetical protein
MHHCSGRGDNQRQPCPTHDKGRVESLIAEECKGKSANQSLETLTWPAMVMRGRLTLNPTSSDRIYNITQTFR